ncbi:MAG: hypothetical protein QW579_04680 [Desulfurococcaceae archaeon]
MVTITCFMIVRNVLRQGYPFVEAIAQALPVCDELLVSDGYSEDGTWDILVKISKLNPKVKLYRDKWPGKSFAHDLRYATNVLRWRCKGDYIFYIQANEVIHEDSWEYLRELPSKWSDMLTFTLPYIMFLGTFKLYERYRLRMARNVDYIEAISDAWTLGLKNSFVVKEFIKSLINPIYFAKIAYRGVHATYANLARYIYNVIVILPKPIYRYQAVFPGDVIRKAKEREEKWNMSLERELLGKIAKLRNAENSMYEIYIIMRESLLKSGFKLPSYKVIEAPVSDHPKIMRDILNDKESRHYYVREELFEIIKGA